MRDRLAEVARRAAAEATLTKTRTIVLVAAVVVLLVWLAWPVSRPVQFGSNLAAVAATPTTGTTTSPVAPSTSPPSPTPTASTTPTPDVTEQAISTAGPVITDFLTLYYTPDPPLEAWLGRLEPLVTADLLRGLAYTDLDQIQAGEPSLDMEWVKVSPTYVEVYSPAPDGTLLRVSAVDYGAGFAVSQIRVADGDGLA